MRRQIVRMFQQISSAQNRPALAELQWGYRQAFAFPVQSHYPASLHGACGTGISTIMDTKHAPKTGTCPHDEQSG